VNTQWQRRMRSTPLRHLSAWSQPPVAPSPWQTVRSPVAKRAQQARPHPSLSLQRDCMIHGCHAIQYPRKHTASEHTVGTDRLGWCLGQRDRKPCNSRSCTGIPTLSMQLQRTHLIKQTTPSFTEQSTPEAADAAASTLAATARASKSRGFT
jgi:hypothetical protein